MEAQRRASARAGLREGEISQGRQKRPKTPSHSQRLLVHEPSVGPREVPEWQVSLSSHHPQELRPTQLVHDPAVRQGSVGAGHWLLVHAQESQVP